MTPLAGRSSRRSRRRWPGALPTALVVAAVLFAALVTGCTSDEAADPTARTTPGGDTVAAGTSKIPADDETAIRAAIDRLNATATGSVADQQATLAALVDPALASALDQCPAATTTLHFEPVYRELRASPDWTAQSGSLAGTVYAVPSLVRIYTGNRITGTDLTTLHLGVQAGEAYLTPLCVG